MKLGMGIAGTVLGLIALLNLNRSFSEAPQQNVTTTAIVKKVYDGDTVVVVFQKEARIRMLDCWASEVRTSDPEEKEKGIKAREYLRSMIKEGDEVLVQIPMSHKLQSSLTFGRVLAYLWKDVNGDGDMENLSTTMVESGHATQEKEK